MRSPSLRAIVLAPVIALALFGSTADLGQAGQARNTLGVMVRVVASCSAAVAPGSGAPVATACPSASAPLAIMTESVSPDPAAATVYVAEEGAADAEFRYLTLIY